LENTTSIKVGNWCFGLDSAMNAKFPISRGYVLEKKGRDCVVVRYRHEGNVSDWTEDISHVFGALQEAHLYLHKQLVNKKIVKAAKDGNMEKLLRRLRRNPLQLLMPRLISRKSDYNYTTNNTAAAVDCLTEQRGLHSNPANCFFMIMNRSVGPRLHALHSQVFQFGPGRNQETSTESLSWHEAEIISMANREKLRQATRTKYSRLLREQNHGSIQDSLAKGTLDAVLVPVFYWAEDASNDHWFLAVLNFKESKYEIWDSLKRYPLDYYEVLQQMQLLKEAIVMDVQLADYQPWTTKDTVPHPDAVQQTNGVDCGLFMCNFALEFARHGNARNVLREDVQAVGFGGFRGRLLCYICCGEIPNLPR